MYQHKRVQDINECQQYRMDHLLQLAENFRYMEGNNLPAVWESTHFLWLRIWGKNTMIKKLEHIIWSRMHEFQQGDIIKVIQYMPSFFYIEEYVDDLN